MRDTPSVLPISRTRLVGRDVERRAAGAQLLDKAAALLTLTGPGGVGKTRLALAVAYDLADAFADGIAFVDLSPIRDPDHVLPAVAQALAVREPDERALADALATALRQRQLLLVLDNCEQVLDAMPVIADLLVACPGLHVLATSRAPLRVGAEQVLEVPPLALPAAGEAPARLPEVASVALFLQRARATVAGFAPGEADLRAIAEICRRLDGLPLAIELAAARSGLLTPTALLTRFGDRLGALGEGPRDAPARQRTLRDAIAWSHDLLSPAEQVLFRRLGVFVGGFSLGAAAEVVPAAGATELDVERGIEALLEHGLLRTIASPVPGESEPRLAMLETVREFALEHLTASGEEGAVRDSHAGYFLARAERFGIVLIRQTVTALFDQLEPDRDNLRAALAWLDARGQDEAVVRLASGVWGLWEVRGPAAEFRGWLERAADPAVALPTGIRGRALWQAANLAHRRADYDQMMTMADLGIALFRESGDDPLGLADCLAVRALVDAARGDRARARAFEEEAAEIYRSLGEGGPLALMLANMAWLVANDGDLPRATRMFEEALALGVAAGDSWGVGVTRVALAATAFASGNHARALAHYRDAATTDLSGDRTVLAEILTGIGVLAARRGRSEEAVWLFGAEARLRGPADPLWPHMATERSTWCEAARATLGTVGFEDAWGRGSRLSLAEASAEAETIAVALARPHEAGALAPSASPFGLTPREREVLSLLAEGRSDREIAEALFIAPRTARWHVAAILAKLEVPTRTAAGARAIRDGLV